MTEIERVHLPTDDVRALIGELDAELAGTYLPEQRHGLAIEAIFKPPVRFFVARLDGDAVGCGGVACFDDFAEIKRMYVRASTRGAGVADAIIERLQDEARHAGLRLVRLETGVHQPAAIGFYRRHGFVPCRAFEPYSSLPASAIKTSYFMEKQLG
ncbi:MAG TPA: GNAT family N-acetyltransferase [Candidatus Baltobacteraceae bacterium]|nr:GNAT family N-acetyltransferase [Candidatus Baltobacteraceae bacterium]